MPDDLPALDDRVAITELLYHYCWLVDSREPDRLLSEFYSDDAVDDHGIGKLETPEQIRGFMQQMMELTEGLMHVLSNVHVELDGDTARARSYVTGWHWFAAEAHKGPQRPADYVGVGVYLDELRRAPEGWRVTNRRLISTGPGLVGIGQMPEL